MENIKILQLIDRLRETIGYVNVIADEKELEILSRTCIPYRELPSVIVYPTNAQQVSQVVLLAKEFSIPIWPVSTGKNWGYGEQTACYPDGITMILNRMTKIWHVDERLGYAIVEPGVTYQHLNDHLKENKIKLWADVSGSTQSGSVIGNALDKGRGVTPYADHFGALCGMDVVLADGQILETGGGIQGNNQARHVYKWGLGPYLDGIFAQSNYGIVVKAGVWLMPKPEKFDWAVFEYTVAEEKFGALIDDMRNLCFQGAMRARPHLANDFAMMCIVSQYPHDLLAGKRCLDEKDMAVWRKKHGVARFTFGCGLYGSKEEVSYQRHTLRRVLGKYGMVQFLGAAANDDLQGKVLRFLAPAVNRLIGKSSAFTDALLPGINLFKGIPTDFFAKQVYFKTFKEKPKKSIVDPAKDQCGLLWIGPLVPLVSEHIEKALKLSKEISAKYEFDYFLEVIIESPRAAIFLLGVFYERNDPQESSRAHAWYNETRERFLTNGYPAYRTTTMSMPHSLDKNTVTKNFLESIKMAVDPSNVIAPGRYGIMPKETALPHGVTTKNTTESDRPEQAQAPKQLEPEIAYTFVTRLTQLVSLFFEVITEVIVYKFNSGSLSKLHRKLGQIFRYRLGRLRGPLQKIGQMLSYMQADLPDEFRDEIRGLVRDGQTIDPSVIRAIVEKELKQPLSNVFAEWRDVPLSSASIGQVHFARLLTGEQVAVKVLLPQMDKIVRSDLLLLELSLPIIGAIWKNPNIKAHFKELKSLCIKECDLATEADNYQLFYNLYKDDPDIIIPKVYKPFCTSKVLVTSYIDGITFEQFLRQADKPQRKKVAETIWKFHCESINRYAVFNADPHSGNYIINGDRVAFIDFGFCKKWDPCFINLWKKQTISGCQGDVKGFIEATKAMGFKKPGDPYFIKDLLSVYRDVFYAPWINDRDFKITHPYLKYHLGTIFERLISRGNIHVPVEFLALTRLYFEKFAIMAELDVELNYYRMTMPHIESTTVSQRTSSNTMVI